MEKLLSAFPVITQISVAWGEMDAFSHVNNVAYFRYFESARISYFEKLKLLDHLELTGIGPILGSISCKFKAPLTYPDIVHVGSSITRIEEDRFTMSHRAVSEKLGKVAAEGEGILVSYNYRKSIKSSIPDVIVKRIEEIQKGVTSDE
ncbi:acyl-CoA thioesterase [bacterium]|nr:acyl-CoA thioesterase [bacterium]